MKYILNKSKDYMKYINNRSGFDKNISYNVNFMKYKYCNKMKGVFNGLG